MFNKLACFPAFLLIAAAALLAGGCGAAGQAPGTGTDTGAKGTITVSAAISLKDVLAGLGKNFEKTHPGTTVKFNFGASGDLEEQIIAGAPVDVFASAGVKETSDLSGKGKILSGTLSEPAENEVVLVIPAQGSSSGCGASFASLAGPACGKIAIGSPETVPAGRYARDVLNYYGIWNKVKSRLVYAESVRQVLDYVARGEVDAGLVYTTDALTSPGQVKVTQTAPEASHQPVVYPVAVIAGSPREALAREFVSYLGSPQAATVFKKYGFKVKGS